MSGATSILAPAKVNLFLHVGPVRGDGRHDLDSLVVFADARAADTLEVLPEKAFSLQVTGPHAAAAGPLEDNLVMKAQRLLEATAGDLPGMAVTLEKALPVAAGIGGGSADAGAFLRHVGHLAGVPGGALLALAARLGGDVPAALGARPCRMRGDGDRVEPVDDLPALAAVLANPGVPCPTGPVFRAYDAAGGGAGFAETDLPAFDGAGALIGWLAAATRNDLEAPATGLVPEIGACLGALDRLRGAQLARMSGSGATCFALFGEEAAAERAAAQLVAAQPGWWVRATRLGGLP